LNFKVFHHRTEAKHFIVGLSPNNGHSLPDLDLLQVVNPRLCQKQVKAWLIYKHKLWQNYQRLDLDLGILVRLELVRSNQHVVAAVLGIFLV